jgi:tyrosyl-tRNA synthetase
MDLLTEHAAIFPSKGELKRTIQGNGLSINKEKYNQLNGNAQTDMLINNKYMLVQKGKKQYFLIIIK